MNLLPEKNKGYLHEMLWKKNILCEKGDEITRFDGTGMNKNADAGTSLVPE